MADQGPWQRALSLRADTPNADRIDAAAREWKGAAQTLTSAADALERHAVDTERIGGRSGPAIRASFEATTARLTQQAGSLDKGAAALARAHRAVLDARAGRGSDERTAQDVVEAVDAAFRESAAAMAEIHGLTASTPDAGPAEPTGTTPRPRPGPPAPLAPRPAPESVRAPDPDRDEPVVVMRTTRPEIDPAVHPLGTTARPEITTAAPSVLGAPTPAASPPTHVDVPHAGTTAGLAAGGLLGLIGPAVLGRGGLTAPTGVRPIGADGRTVASGAVVPGSPVARTGARTRSAAAPAAGAARRARSKRRAKRVRVSIRRIARRGRDTDARGDDE